MNASVNVNASASRDLAQVALARAAVRRAVAGSVCYAPEDHIPAPLAPFTHRYRYLHMSVTTCEETALVVARRLTTECRAPVVLSFASARNPGGGFRAGASGQEESLCRVSALAACLESPQVAPFYRAGTQASALNTSWMIYSPDVPVWGVSDGSDGGTWLVSFISCAAPNAKELLRTRTGAGDPEQEIAQAFDERIHRVLALAAARDHASVVLGAWGCGAFGCDPRMVAARFHEALTGSFRGAFERVVFALSAGKDVLRAFAACFGEAALGTGARR